MARLFNMEKEATGELLFKIWRESRARQITKREGGTYRVASFKCYLKVKWASLTFPLCMKDRVALCQGYIKKSQIISWAMSNVYSFLSEMVIISNFIGLNLMLFKISSLWDSVSFNDTYSFSQLRAGQDAQYFTSWTKIHNKWIIWRWHLRVLGLSFLPVYLYWNCLIVLAS